MIATLLITIAVEAIVAIGYSSWHRKPLILILVTSIGANLITQSFLWLALNLFFNHYLIVLLVSEVLIWIVESLLLYSIPSNRLRFTEAIFLSLLMNLASFMPGWFLPL